LTFLIEHRIDYQRVKKVNTALDNPLNFFTAKALNSRASDLSGFKDGMSEAVQTLKAANNGITAIEGLIAQAKAVAATAKAGVEGGSGSYSNITVDLNSVTNGQTINVGTQTFTAVGTDVQQTISFISITNGNTITVNGQAYTAAATGVYWAATTTAQLTMFLSDGTDIQDAADFLRVLNAHEGITAASVTAGSTQVVLSLVASSWGAATGSATMSVITNATISLATTGSLNYFIGGNASQDTSNLASKINSFGEVAASVNNGTHINILAGTSTLTSNTVSAAATSFSIAAYQVTTDRSSYALQFNDIMNQLDLLAADSGYKGINFLSASSSLDVEFGTTAGDKITLTGFSAAATSLLAKADGLKTATNSWATNTDVDVDIAGLTAATSTLKTEASRLSSGLGIINSRQDWVKGMVNTLIAGADNLTAADMNEEGANMLMLQTRQTLGTTALSLSAQAAQSVLRLFA